MLTEADKHRKKAARHAAAIAASQGADNPDPDDGHDDDVDSELAYEAERRKHVIEVYARAWSGDASAARRARAIEIARLAHSA